MATGPIDAWLKNPRGPLVPAIRPKPVAVCTEKQTVIVKKFSTKPAAVRSRKRRAAAAKKKLAKTPTNVTALETGDSDSDSGDAQQKKKPKIRTHLAGSNGVVSTSQTGGESRIWTPMERSFVLAEMAEYLSRFNTDDGCLPDESHYYSEVAGKLRFRYKSIFGVGSPGKPLGITRQNVRTIMVQSRQAHLEDERGRPPAVPGWLLVFILSALNAAVSSKTTLYSLALLQPIVIATIKFALARRRRKEEAWSFLCFSRLAF
jgi:hypothetical protein